MNNFSSVWYRFPHTTHSILLHLYHMNSFSSVWYKFSHTTHSILLHPYHMNSFSSVWYRFPHTTYSILLYLYHMNSFSSVWYRFSTHDSFNSSLSVPYEQLFLCMVQIPHLSTKIFHTNSLLPRNHVHMGQICKKLNNNKLRIYLISHTTIFVCGKYVKV